MVTAKLTEYELNLDPFPEKFDVVFVKELRQGMLTLYFTGGVELTDYTVQFISIVTCNIFTPLAIGAPLIISPIVSAIALGGLIVLTQAIDNKPGLGVNATGIQP